MLDWVGLNRDLYTQSQQTDFAGYDPFDALNSRLFTWFPALKNTWFGLAWLQFHKRSPFNLRRVCAVAPARNPKGVALFILGLLEEYQRTKAPGLLEQGQELADWLLTQQCDESEWTFPCWGYHFDWKARAFYVPKGKPNMITTYYVSQALLSLGDACQRSDYCSAGLQSAYFMEKYLLRSGESGAYLAYIPGEETFVHNASLWGAAWMVVAGKRLDEQRLVNTGFEVADTSVQAQLPDGSWHYGTRAHHKFIDGFHTGYNLEALDLIQQATGQPRYQDAIDKGFQYYLKHFISPDFDVNYYHNQPYPYDMHSVSQAVLTLLKIGGAEHLPAVEKILERAKQVLYLPDKKRFAYQKSQRFLNKVDYVRWTRAWVYLALAYFNRVSQEGSLDEAN